jgi:hypothetical protein
VSKSLQLLNTLKSVPVLSHVLRIKTQFDLLQAVQASPHEVEFVMGHLKYKPEMWVNIDSVHPWYADIKYSLTTLLRDLPLSSHNDLTFLLNLESRWLLVGIDGAAKFRVVPAIFLYTEHRKDGLSVSFYKILSGVSLSSPWLDEFTRLFLATLTSCKEESHPTLPDYELPLAGFIL